MAIDATSSSAVGSESFLFGLPHLLDFTAGLWARKLDSELRNVGLAFEQWRLLLVAANHPPMKIKELSELTLVPHSTIGRWVSAMETDDLLERAVDEKDNRAIRIGITKKGRLLYAGTAAFAQKIYLDGTRDFTPKEIEEFRSFSIRILKNLDPDSAVIFGGMI